jgi:hypothetical protein
MNKDLKLPPYQRLKSIFNEGELTDKASDNLDELLGLKKEKKNNFFTKIIDFFKKIDSYIFRKPSKINNNIPHKRLK